MTNPKLNSHRDYAILNFDYAYFFESCIPHWECCHDDIGDLPGSPEHLWLRENANEIG